MPDNYVSAIVTDPPYGLSFMGKKWDYDVPSVEIWRECLRVLKPGGFLLSFAGTRTQHRMACNIEDAGFEIRDMIAWIYGSGFPKSLSVGKAVDKLQGNEREVVGTKTVKGGENLNKISRENKNDSINAKGCGAYGKGAKQTNIEINDTKGTSDYEGWGTGLKPAMEPITVARKPLSEKTVAKNCLKWGTGGINIDACRVELNGDYKCKANGRPSQTGLDDNYISEKANKPDDIGRFPANVIHDGSEEVTSLFPQTKSGKMKQHIEGGIFNVYAKQCPRNVETIGDSGSAARFFYCAKASKSERQLGCEDIYWLDGVLITKELYDIFKAENESNRDNEEFIQHNIVHGNTHPTVKPISLMEYLIKLVSREGDLIMDPFAGSGSTGIAAQNLNRRFVLFEMEKESVEICKRRLAGYRKS